MLPLPNLDDRFFEEIVADARRMIPKLLPQWTDENYHDPGITMLELFSWLTEMQQYYLDRVTVRNELKFLSLLGIRLKQAESARADVTFDNVPAPLVLPKGTKLLAKDQPFETESTLLLHPAKIDRVIVSSDSESYDFTSANESSKGGYYAFGPVAKQGNRLHIAFDSELPVGQTLSIMVNLFEPNTVPLILPEKGAPPLTPSANVSWKFYGNESGNPNQAGTWLPLEIVHDGTMHLSHSGRVRFRLSHPMSRMLVHPANDKRRFWISCTVEEEGYEIAPKIEKICFNTTPAVQRDTLAEVIPFDGTGKPLQVFRAGEYLAFFGKVEAHVQEADGTWRDWTVVDDLATCGPQDRCCKITRNDEAKSTLLEFGDNVHGRIPPKGKGNVRLIAFTPEFEAERYLGQSNGLPYQRFSIYRKPLLLEHFALQVGVQIPSTKEIAWQDWTRVDDFEHSTARDLHYAVDLSLDEGQISFGNHEAGMIPEKAEEFENIRILAMKVGGGERGNVNKHMIREIAGHHPAFGEIAVTNHFYAKGGREHETLEQAKSRLRQDFKKPYRAVSSVDFEEIARNTPGVRVARVKAIPMYHTGLRNYPQQKAPAQVTLVVAPYSDMKKPSPSQGFLNTVKQHVDQHRLLTTEVHIVPPEYVKITVHAVVVVDPSFKDQTDRVVTALSRYLDPLDDENAAKGWSFGRAVYKGDVFGVINQLPGVEYIQDLYFDAEGNGIRKDSSGDIHLPPHGLVYSGEHQIELVSITDV